MSRVVHFELSASDPQRAANFYGGIFGWRFQKWDGPDEYWLVTTGEDGTPGINGGLMRTQEQWPPGVINTVGVESVDAYLEKVKAHGGEVVVPKTAVQGIGYLAYCKDPDGVVFGLFETDETAGG